MGKLSQIFRTPSSAWKGGTVLNLTGVIATPMASGKANREFTQVKKQIINGSYVS